ncbi:4-hydroxythreonine-4-phosphate dehydrogenase PdxA [Altererythrobacter sp. MTPC7]|uniref:4-hydroxythreonine-4-phosphate dehydrogenase PdxA n=1 Tax=Altererythrobacter sp. MTPC7 TaxID=3056567 RepID=UPI0036F3256C
MVAPASPKPALPLALSIGDPAGIGPELAVLAWHAREGRGAAQPLPPFFAMHGAGVLRAASERLGLDTPLERIAAPADAGAVFGHALPVLGQADGPYTPGAPGDDGALLALASLQDAARLAYEDKASGIVTLPVAKAQLAAIGFAHPGQTEFLAAACDLPPGASVMMLAGPSLKAVPLTVHCALADVPSRLSVDLIVRRGRIVADALRRDYGIQRPRLAVTGLNPHAGEGGAFGREEIEIIAPAIEALRAQGVEASGPHPADALFAPRSRAGFDAALCMYHDQALIPVKALDFDQGVNVTLGLSIVRTSPDHGTAFDIAGTGQADPGATLAALVMAGEIAARRLDAGGADG